MNNSIFEFNQENNQQAAQQDDFMATIREVLSRMQVSKPTSQTGQTVDDFFDDFFGPTIEEEFVSSSNSTSPSSTILAPPSPTSTVLSDNDARDFASLLDAIPTITIKSRKPRQGKIDEFVLSEINLQDAAAMTYDKNLLTVPELLTTSCQFSYALEVNKPIQLVADLVCLLDFEATPIALNTLKSKLTYDLSISKKDPNRKQRSKLLYALRLTCAETGAVRLYGPFVLASRPKKNNDSPKTMAANINNNVVPPTTLTPLKTQATKRIRESDELKLRDQEQ